MANSFNRAPLVSVIILNFNGGEYVLNCIRSVLANTYTRFEVIVVDNGSTDGSPERVKEEFGAQIVIARNDRNLGMGAGMSEGEKLAKGEYIACLHNDAIPDPNWLEEVIKVMQGDSRIGCAQSLVKQMDDDSFGLLGGLASRCLLDYPPMQLRSSNLTVRDIGFSIGAATTLRHDLIDRIGFFDPDYFVSNEDLDLGWRIWLSGYRVVGIPKSVVYHKGGVGAGRLGPFLDYLHSRNTLITMIKNYRLRNVFQCVPLAIILYTIFAFGDIIIYGRTKVDLGGPWKVIVYKKIILLRETLWILRNLRPIWRKREFVQKRVRVVKDDDIFIRIAENNGLPRALITNPGPYWIKLRLNKYF